MGEPFFSIIIPVYNAQTTLQYCVSSILNQTFTDYEVIIINDNSSDASDFIIEAFEKANSKVNSVKNTINKGAGGSRNAGLDISRGTYLFFLDADDQLANEFVLENIYKALSLSPDVLLFNYKNLIHETGDVELSNRTREVQFWNNIAEGKCKSGVLFDFKEHLLFPAYPWNKVFNREFIINEKIRFSEIHCHNDIYFVWAALLHSSKICCFNYTAVLYLHHSEESRITNLGSIKRFDFFKAIDSVEKEFNNQINHNDQLFVLFMIFKFQVFSWGSRHLKRKYLWSFIRRYKKRFDRKFYYQNKKLFKMFFSRKTEHMLFKISAFHSILYWILLYSYPMYQKMVENLFRSKNGR